MPEYIIESVAAMHELAATILGSCRGGDLLLLYGELGSGKTTFTQGLAQALGINVPVTSPTFTVMAEYSVSAHPTITQLRHADLYRLKTAATDPLVQELLRESGSPELVTIIEWADRLGDAVSVIAQRVYFQVGDKQSQRVVTLEA